VVRSFDVTSPCSAIARQCVPITCPVHVRCCCRCYTWPVESHCCNNHCAVSTHTHQKLTTHPPLRAADQCWVREYSYNCGWTLVTCRVQGSEVQGGGLCPCPVQAPSVHQAVG
jgi:hypothetical protein